METKQPEKLSPSLLVGAVLVAVASGVCCIGPFLLLATGLSGAWMSNLMVLEPYQPILAAVSVSIVFYAGWQLFSRKSSCTTAGTVILRSKARLQLAMFLLVLSLVLVLITSEYWIVRFAG